MNRTNMKRVFLIGLPLAAFGAALILAASLRFLPAKAGCGCLPSIDKATGEYEATEKTAIFQNQPVEYPLAELKEGIDGKEGQEEVMGVVSPEVLVQRWIEVDLSEQKLYAHEGNRIVYEFWVSSGKWAPTPTGEFEIWSKFRYTKMSGGRKENRTYYYLPNVPYTQYFYRDFGLHGTYWHNNFGQPMSHGCVNLSIPDAEKLFWWTAPVMPTGKNFLRASRDNPGTKVVVHE